MIRWPYLPLALTLVGAVAVVCCPRTPDPAEVTPPAETEALAEGVPEAAVLRVNAKKLIAREVAAGRRSLVEAAALFGALNRLPPRSTDLARQDLHHDWALRVPARTEEERLCRQVVEWVDGLRRSESPESVAATVARLTAEFREELRRHGAIRLPDPSSLPSAKELLDQARKAMTEVERKAILSPPGRP